MRIKKKNKAGPKTREIFVVYKRWLFTNRGPIVEDVDSMYTERPYAEKRFAKLLSLVGKTPCLVDARLGTRIVRVR